MPQPTACPLPVDLLLMANGCRVKVTRTHTDLLIWYFKFSSVEKLTRGLPGVLIPLNSHSPHSPLPTTLTVILITRDYELDPRSKSRVAAIQIGSFLARVTC
eukprot:COSAG05_NODE_1773_length_4111_cov_50.409771_3_plen_101_part_01